MPGRFEPSEREALAGLSSCFSFQNNDRYALQHIMYVVTPSEPIYHLAQNNSLTFCGLSLNHNPEHRKRRGDRRLSEEIPDKQFVALCSECDRKATGKPEPKRPSVELLRSRVLIDIVA